MPAAIALVLVASTAALAAKPARDVPQRHGRRPASVDQRLPRQPRTRAAPGSSGRIGAINGRAASSTSPRTSATLRAPNPNTVVVSAGDLIGATPAAVGALPRRADDRGDEPDGPRLQRRRQPRVRRGRDRAAPACRTAAATPSTAASTATASRRRLPVPGRQRDLQGHRRDDLPAVPDPSFDGAKVAFIGMTSKGTPTIVTPGGVADLDFHDEADTVNALVPELKTKGVESDRRPDPRGRRRSRWRRPPRQRLRRHLGAIADIVNALDDEVDVVLTGHTHKAVQLRHRRQGGDRSGSAGSAVHGHRRKIDGRPTNHQADPVDNRHRHPGRRQGRRRDGPDRRVQGLGGPSPRS